MPLMKRVAYALGTLLLLTILTSLPWAFLAGDVTKVFEGAALNFKIARLAAKEPDRRLALPVRTVRVKLIGDTWQAARPEGRRHQGQDIFAKRGTPVHSATAGLVMRVREDRLGGLTVSVVGAGGRIYYYAHLDSYAPGLSVGDPVTTDTVLGYVGTTGNALGTPPHLHFGVYTPSGPIDPLPLLTD